MVEIDTRFPTERLRFARIGRERLAPLADAIVRELRTEGVISRERNAHLAVVLADFSSEIVADVGTKVTRSLGVGDTEARGAWSPEGTTNYVTAFSEAMAIGTLDEIRAEAAVAGFLTLDVLDRFRERLLSLADSATATSVNFAALDAAERGGATHKRWQVNSGNPRSSHAGLSGQVVPVGRNFSNGLPYPRGGGPARETANCECSMVLIKEDA